MKNFENFMEEVGKFLEQTEAILSEITKDTEAEPEKKGVSWDELSDWVAESEGVQEFEEDSDAEQPVYVTKEADLHATCANCEQCEDCGECGCDEYLNHDSYDEACDEYWEWITEERERNDDEDAQESEPAPASLSLRDYREALFRHSEERNSEYPQEANLKLTQIFSNVIWEILEGPNSATPEEISTAHNILCDSKYLRALIKSQVNSPGMEIDVLGVENEIKKYLKEKN